MPDRTRFFMSIFLFAVLALNPLGSLIANQAPAFGDAAGDYKGSHGGSRSLFEFTDDAPGKCCVKRVIITSKTLSFCVL